MNEEQAFLGAICAEPADDISRLVYADWLQEHGRPERAELIRVQVELSKFDFPKCEQPKRVSTPGNPWRGEAGQPIESACNVCDACRYRVKSEKAARPLRAREEALLFTTPDAHQDRLRIDWAGDVHLNLHSWKWTRGFIGEVWTTGSHWAFHAERILSQQPVNVVNLTSWPQALRDSLQSNVKRSWRFEGRQEWVPVANGEHIPSVLLKVIWPKVEFRGPKEGRIVNIPRELLFNDTLGPIVPPSPFIKPGNI